jgi:hypothetical protein
LGDVSIKDEGLQSNTTYYYKAKVVGGSNYSEVVSATTLVDNSEEEEPGAENNGNYRNEVWRYFGQKQRPYDCRRRKDCS